MLICNDKCKDHIEGHHTDRYCKNESYQNEPK